MKHLGDITLIHGNEIKPVDCIIGGSPCQDLSVAGKRAGLSGERSGLFMEQIRIVKEMRKRYGKPRYMVWENVPGAFSSNNGEDFRAVLEEVTRIADETAVIPRPPKGKWSYAGCIMGDGWSVAWRTHDAQFWGVPQRRRRIALVADFGGESAPEILFERESVSRDSQESGTPWKGITTDAQGSPHANDRKGYESGIIAVAFSFDSLASNSMKSSNSHSGCREVEVSKTLDTTDPNPSKNQGGIAIVQPTLRLNDQGGSVMSVSEDVADILRAQQHGHQPAICIQGNGIDRADTAGCNGKGWTEDVSYTLNTIDRPAVAFCTDVGMFTSAEGKATSLLARQYKDPPLVSYNDYTDRCHYIVRRLTPLECERLQGYPDGWTDIGDWTDSKGKLHKAADAPRYKALGNSIALPFWDWMLRRMSEHLLTGATMGSLFDGIGGFPLLWERIHGAGTARWASEIEEFAIAVTKIRFPEGTTK